MKNFTIDPQYLTSVETREHRTIHGGEDMFRAIGTYTFSGVFIGSKDHPEFTKLREQLGEEGFIYIERGWWNGDYVLKPFMLNGVEFKKGFKFVCGVAMKSALKFGPI